MTVRELKEKLKDCSDDGVLTVVLFNDSVELYSVDGDDGELIYTFNEEINWRP